MRLYTLLDASSVHDEDHGSFDVDPETGAVEVPQELGLLLHRTHIGGRKAWEDDAERSTRLAEEDLARRKDPATLLAAVEALAGNLAAAQQPPASASVAKPVTEMTYAELQGHAAGLGIDVKVVKKKAALLEAIAASSGPSAD